MPSPDSPTQCAATSRPLRILQVTAEMAPLLKTGGLGDVAYALPKALKALGHDVRIALPCYGSLPHDARGEPRFACLGDFGASTEYGLLRESRAPSTEIPLYLIEHNGMFDRRNPYGEGGYAYHDSLRRFSFFCLAVMNAVEQLDWKPDIVHCHDWHTAVLPAILKVRQQKSSFWSETASLYTIHNLAYQGTFSPNQWMDTGLPDEMFHADGFEHFDDINLMKGGILFADKISTVSRRYAKEIQTPEFGNGLDGILTRRRADTTGILNGVDYGEWSPVTDRFIAKTFRSDDLSGKAQCKTALQLKLDFPLSNASLFGMVTRFDWQKGLDILASAMDRILEHDLQMAILGTGDSQYEKLFDEKARANPDKLRVLRRFDVGLSHEIQAASDFYLMPSHYEPSGLSQLYALAYGAIPIVRRTGGLSDSIIDASETNIENNRATGFVFNAPTADALLHAIHRALDLTKNPTLFAKVRLNGMRQEYSWESAARLYVRLYEKTMRKA